MTAVDGMLHDDKQEVWATFLGPIGINDSNKAEYIPTREVIISLSHVLKDH